MKAVCALTLLSLLTSLTASSAQSTTAWHEGSFHVDTAGVISRSAIVLGRPNVDEGQAMPLGNGSLGVAIWSADGLTAQLNRADTLPDRLSPGQIVLPGLSALTLSKDYSGRLDLYNGEFRESGGGMSMTSYVQPKTDTLVIEVLGAKPNVQQTVRLKLWEPRSPKAVVNGQIGSLVQSWIDDKKPESSGRAFGSLAAITVQGRNVSADVTNPLTITVSFQPYADGHFKVLAAAPHYDGKQNYIDVVHTALADTTSDAHREHWNSFWQRAAPIKITSADGSGEYMENLRNIYLFVAAAEKGVEYPGSQAGVADMVSSGQDVHRWDSSSYWHWNLRMMVPANLGAGLPELNEPYFNLYRENLSSIEDWTSKYMMGRPGSCIPETMRFNGRGIEYESSWTPISVGRDCDATAQAYYNTRTISTGAEVSLWVWRQYLATGDDRFLTDHYPIMASSARFLLAYQKEGKDGLRHTSPSNAHETQWDVTDPTTDIAAALALFPATIEAAQLLGKDAELVAQLRAALPQIPPLPRTKANGNLTLQSSAGDNSEDVIAESYLPAAKNHNAENIGLEPVWPYDVIGDTSPLFELALRTYRHRPFSAVADWSFDPLQAARLGLSDEVRSKLIKVTENSQHTPNGLADWDPKYREFYVEQVGVVTAALQEALVQDYDGLIRLAPAVPRDWDVDGNVFVRGKTKVDVQVRQGKITTAVIEVGAAQLYKVRNPWPGRECDVISGESGGKLVVSTKESVITFQGIAGKIYLIKPHGEPVQRFEVISGYPAQTAKRQGKVQIGLFAE
jgi:alpha-L-fucosidase 2